MRSHMKSCLALLLILPLAVCAGLAQSTGELPSAPSARIAPKAAAVPAPTKAPEAPTARQPAAEAARQSAPTAPANSDDNEGLTTITKRVDEVNLVFTVTDRHGRFIKDLKQQDFQIFDDKKPARQIDWFSQQTNLPLRVGLLVDASNSIRDRFKFEQEAAVEFLSTTIRRKADMAFVVGFDATPEVTADFTDNHDDLAHGVRLLRPGGGTAMFDAIFFASRDKLMKAHQEGPVRRAIVLISDGNDNQSRVTREEAIEMAQRAEVIVYAISTNNSAQLTRGDKVMERITEATGGRSFFPLRMQDVSKAFMEIQDELRSQYAVAYKPADFVADGRYRAIEIRADRHKALKVRSRKGYYAPRQ